ncbi:MAG TPA: DUF4340 domain-containing protein [Planctomycetaceae bacterium]|jgi:hypothetical protein|nr:DUF4340 domain-containing protein [Planctomycetaceae bacterium]
MNETKRTLIYLAVALVSVGTATATYYGSRPRKDAESSRIGTEFYPEFKFPTDAQVLRVVAYDKDTASVKEFKVEYKDGKWRIPSHHSYPADGKDRLARTAASVIGTSRTAFVSRSKPDQVKFDVIDPEDPDEAILTGRGQKITISKNDGTVLAEYVIGKRKESASPGQSDIYYVRATKADDPSTIYLANLKIDLSTKFGDWIEPDLLKVDRENLSDIKIDTYSIDEQQGAIIPGEVTELTRKPPGDNWTMSNLKPTEELKNEAINQLVSNLDGLRLVGVRPKPPGVEPDLSIDPRYARDRQLVAVLRNDMAAKGYFVGSDRRGGKERVFSKEGQIEAGTNEGLRYALNFGQIFTGTEFEVETGLSKDAAKDKGATKDGDKTKKADSAKDKGKEKEQLKKNRYLMVYVTFDPKLVGAPPSKPLEPKKPQGLVLDAPKVQPPPSNKPAPTAGNAGTKAESNPQPAGAGKTNEKHSSAARLDDSQMLAMAFPEPQAAPPKSDAKASETKSPKTPSAPPAGSGKPAHAAKSAPNAKPVAPAAPKPDPKAEYDKALAQYKKDLEKYENDKSEFEKKLKKGQDKVKQLNERFGPWYYVISAESFENLRQGRASLVQPKGKAAEKKPGAGLDLHPPLGGMPER